MFFQVWHKMLTSFFQELRSEKLIKISKMQVWKLAFLFGLTILKYCYKEIEESMQLSSDLSRIMFRWRLQMSFITVKVIHLILSFLDGETTMSICIDGKRNNPMESEIMCWNLKSGRWRAISVEKSYWTFWVCEKIWLFLDIFKKVHLGNCRPRYLPAILW